MELQSLLILFGISAAASMDSFSAVLAYSAAGIHIPPRSVWTLGLVSGGLLGLSVLAGSRLGALGAVAQIAGAVLLILLGAGKLAGSWLRSLAARLAEQGPYTFSAWDLRFMLSVYADPTRADADRSGDLTVREAALLAAVLIAVIDALPVLGTGTVLVPWGLYHLLLGTVPRGVALLALYAIIMLVRNLLEPRVMAAQAGLPPLTALLAMYLGFCLFGVGGMILFPILLLFVKQLQDGGFLHLWK